MKLCHHCLQHVRLARLLRLLSDLTLHSLLLLLSAKLRIADCAATLVNLANSRLSYGLTVILFELNADRETHQAWDRQYLSGDRLGVAQSAVGPATGSTGKAAIAADVRRWRTCNAWTVRQDDGTHWPDVLELISRQATLREQAIERATRILSSPDSASLSTALKHSGHAQALPISERPSSFVLRLVSSPVGGLAPLPPKLQLPHFHPLYWRSLASDPAPASNSPTRCRTTTPL